MIRTRAGSAYAWVAWLLAAAAVVQVFLAGLGVFEDPSRFVIHREFGYLIGWFAVVLLVLAIVGRLGRRLIALSILLGVLFALQSVFVLLRSSAPFVAALHPVNGFLIILVALVAGRDAREVVSVRAGDARDPGEAESSSA